MTKKIDDHYCQINCEIKDSLSGKLKKFPHVMCNKKCFLKRLFSFEKKRNYFLLENLQNYNLLIIQNTMRNERANADNIGDMTTVVSCG